MDFSQFITYLHMALTPEQWNAINSGITSIKRQKFENYSYQFQTKMQDEQLEATQSGITAQILHDILTGNFLRSVEGYDSSKVQTLKNYNGALRWVSDMEGE